MSARVEPKDEKTLGVISVTELLFNAIRSADIAQVHQRLDEGAHIDAHWGTPSFTPLLEAIKTGEPDIALGLLDRGASTRTSKATVREYTPLIWAASQGDAMLPVVARLLDGHANINERSRSRSTALMMASAGGHLDMVEFLLSRGADANQVDDQGLSALSHAVLSSYAFPASYALPVMDLLLAHGADVNLVGRGLDNKSSTPLIFSIREVVKQDIRSFLLSRGADPNLADRNGTTPIRRAIEQYSSTMISQLLEGGADPLLVNKDGQSAKDRVDEMLVQYGGPNEAPEPIAEMKSVIDVYLSAQRLDQIGDRITTGKNDSRPPLARGGLSL